MGKALLIIILGSVVLFGVLNLNVNRYLNSDNVNSVNYYADANAKNICNSMVEMLVSRLADSAKYVTDGTVQTTLFGGTVNYSVTRVKFAGDSLTKVYVSANFLERTKEATVYANPNPTQGWVPPVIRAAWTANGDLNKTISDMYIDGRDHKLDYTLNAKAGILGVSSSTKFNNTYKGSIGGTKDSIDYVPTYPENPKVVEQYAWGTTFPKTPDQVLGYTEGTLKAIAQSKFGGSQYVIDPSKLVYPLRGITYVSLKENQSVKVTLKNSGSLPNTGLLIINAPNASSKVNGIANSKPFYGLIITDYSFHHHCDIVGGIIQLSPNLELSHNCSGNRDHFVYFSREAIEIYATGVAAKYANQTGNYTGNSGTSIAAGLGNRRTALAYWRE